MVQLVVLKFVTTILVLFVANAVPVMNWVPMANRATVSYKTPLLSNIRHRYQFLIHFETSKNLETVIKSRESLRLIRVLLYNLILRQILNCEIELL